MDKKRTNEFGTSGEQGEQTGSTEQVSQTPAVTNEEHPKSE